MTLLAEFTLPASDFPLGAVFESHPQARFELDRVIPAGDTFMPYFWVQDDEMEPIRARLADLTALRTVTLLEDLGDKGLFRAEWEPEYGGIMHAVAESGAVVVSATGTARGWTFELRSEDAETFTRFRDVCESRDVDVELARFHRLSRTITGDEYDLTAEQREALALAEALDAEPTPDRAGADDDVLEPLYSAVDPEILDALFEPAGARGRVTFTYRDHAVVVHSEGRVTVDPVELADLRSSD